MVAFWTVVRGVVPLHGFADEFDLLDALRVATLVLDMHHDLRLLNGGLVARHVKAHRAASFTHTVPLVAHIAVVDHRGSC